MELQQTALPGHQLIRAYRPGGFTIGNVRYEGAVLVTAAGVHAWSVDPTRPIDGEALGRALIESAVRIDLVIIGTGPLALLLTATSRAALRVAGLTAEVMTTPAACRTYNVLIGEDRRVAAALIAMP